MPELPEVETVRAGLVPAMEGRRILKATVNRPDLRFPLPEGLADRLTGRRVLSLRRRSKYILADLDGPVAGQAGEVLLLHLGMSGRILVSGRTLGAFHQDHPVPEKHDHVVIDLEGGARGTFNDARRFGSIDLIAPGAEGEHPLLRAIGPEPLGNAFHADYLAGRLAGRRTPVKAALLDHRIVAGLGNIYVAETLYRAGIDPRRLAGALGADDIARLVTEVRAVLAEAIEAGGSTLRDYRHADGELGYFQHSVRVYGREREPCRTPGCKGTIARITQSGRSSFFCPVCQRP